MLGSEFDFLNCIEFRDDDDFFSFDREERRLLDFDEIFESASKLLSPSKKISKLSRQSSQQPTLTAESSDISNSKKKKMQSTISRENAQRLTPFFKKWKELRKTDKIFKQQMKYWFSSFSLRVNKTYIYRDLSDNVRLHFRLVVPDDYTFAEMEDSEWQSLFINLTEFLTEEATKMKDEIDKGKKCQVYPVYMESLNQWTVGKLSTHLE